MIFSSWRITFKSRGQRNFASFHVYETWKWSALYTFNYFFLQFQKVVAAPDVTKYAKRRDALVVEVVILMELAIADVDYILLECCYDKILLYLNW